jgi:sugar lactone lactonase YvrE
MKFDTRVFLSCRPLARVASWAAVGSLALALAGCGGGGGSEGPGVSPGSQPPGQAGELSLVTGGVGGAGHVDGAGAQARFDGPSGLVLDADGNLYVSDTGNAVIRRITPQAEVSTFAGKAGATGAVDGQGAAARFAGPTAMARDVAGNLFVLDGESIRRITPAGLVSTVARSTGFSDWTSLAVDAAGRFYGVHRGLNCPPIRLMSCVVDERVLVATLTAVPDGVAVDSVPGVPAVPPDSPTVPSDIVGNRPVFSVANDARGRVVVARLTSQDANGLMDFFLAGASGAFEALNLPESARRIAGYCQNCATGPTWQLKVAWEGDEGFRVVLKVGGFSIPASTTVASFSRSGAAPLQATSFNFSSADGAFAQAGFRGVSAIAIDAQRRLFLADAGNHTIRTLSPQGAVETWAGAAPDTALQDQLQSSQQKPYHQAVIAFCDVTVGGNGTDLYANFCDSLTKPPTPSFFTETERSIHRITGSSTAETVALGHTNQFGRVPFGVDAAGDIYVDGRRYSRSGVLKANFNDQSEEGFVPHAATVAPQGGAYFANAAQIRYLAPGAAAPVVLAGGRPQDAGAFTGIRDLAADADGNVYVLDAQTVNGAADPFVQSQLKKVSPNGAVQVLAGRPLAQGADDGPGSSATFRNAQGLAVDRRGNVYVADTGNHTVRKITPDGQVSTLVGVPGQKGTLLGALPGRLASPSSVAVDANDMLYIATPNAVLKVKLPQ